MKRFDATKPKYMIFLKQKILINFLHKRYMDFTHEVIRE